MATAQSMTERSGLIDQVGVRHLALLVCIVLLVWVPRLSGPIDLRYDGGVYYILGTSLAEGKGYRLLNEPGEIEAVQYPPLLPVFVAAHQRVLGTSDTIVVGQALRFSFLALLVAYAIATYALARRLLTPGFALLVGALTSLQHFTVFLSDLLFAEIPFALATVAFVVCHRASRRGRFVLMALLGTVAFLLRSLGIALFGAWIADAFLRRHFGQAVLRLAVALVPILLWYSFIARVTTGPEYTHPTYPYQRAPYQYYNVSYASNLQLIDPFRPELGQASPVDLGRRLLSNAGGLIPYLGEAVVGPRRFWENSLGRIHWRLSGTVNLLFGTLVLAGLGLLARRGEWLIPLYVMASVSIIFITPWPAQFTRYLSPLAPFLALALAELLLRARRWSLQRPESEAIRIITHATATLAVAMQVTQLLMAFALWHEPATHVDARGTRADGRLFYYDHRWQAFDTSLDWFRQHAVGEGVVATSAPHRIYLTTGLKAVLPPLEADTALAQRLLDSVPVRYVIVDDLTFTDMSRWYAGPVVQSRPDLWELVYAEGARIYRRRDVPPSGAARTVAVPGRPEG